MIPVIAGMAIAALAAQAMKKGQGGGGGGPGLAQPISLGAKPLMQQPFGGGMQQQMSSMMQPPMQQQAQMPGFLSQMLGNRYRGV